MLIIDEFDEIMYKRMYGIYNDAISGIWSLKDKNVYAFSATSSTPIERFVHKTIGLFQKLMFKSEYEFIHGTSPV